MYGVSKTVTRALSCWAIAMALLQLEEYGFQQVTGPHFWPLKYKVSSRGKAATTSTPVMPELSVGSFGAWAELVVKPAIMLSMMTRLIQKKIKLRFIISSSWIASVVHC